MPETEELAYLKCFVFGLCAVCRWLGDTKKYLVQHLDANEFVFVLFADWWWCRDGSLRWRFQISLLFEDGRLFTSGTDEFGRTIVSWLRDDDVSCFICFKCSRVSLVSLL